MLARAMLDAGVMTSEPRTLLVAVGEHSNPLDPVQMNVSDVVKWYNLVLIAEGEGKDFLRASVSSSNLQVGEMVTEAGFIRIGPHGWSFELSDSPDHDGYRHSLLLTAMAAGPAEATIVFRLAHPLPHEVSYHLFVNISPR